MRAEHWGVFPLSIAQSKVKVYVQSAMPTNSLTSLNWLRHCSTERIVAYKSYKARRACGQGHHNQQHIAQEMQNKERKHTQKAQDTGRGTVEMQGPHARDCRNEPQSHLGWVRRPPSKDGKHDRRTGRVTERSLEGSVSEDIARGGSYVGPVGGDVGGLEES